MTARLLHQAAQKAVEALQLAHAGLEWYRDRFSEVVDGSDEEADEKIGDALAALESALQHQEVPREPVAWRWKYGDTDHHKWIVMDIPPMGAPVFRLEPLYAAPSTTRQQEVGSTAARDVLAERARQISAEGWTAEHDDEHGDGQLAFAAACYAKHASARAWMFGSLDDAAERYAADDSPDDWPDSWDTSWWRPKNPRRDLVRAAALLLAEIERMDRAAAPSTPEKAGGVSEQPKEADRG